MFSIRGTDAVRYMSMPADVQSTYRTDSQGRRRKIA
jgi:hypothetical protein